MPQHPPATQSIPLSESILSRDLRLGIARARTFASFDISSNLSQLDGGKLGYQEFLACLPSRVFFSHVYKAAGTTMNYIIGSGCASQQDLLCFKEHVGGACGAKYLPHPAPYSAGAFGTAAEPQVSVTAREPPDGAFIFSIVKDPVARTISALRELKRRGRWKNALHAGSLGEVVTSVREQGYFDSHLQPQVYFLLHPDSSRRPSNIRKLPLDLIGTTSELSSIVAYVQGRFGNGQQLLTPEAWLQSVGNASEMSLRLAVATQTLSSSSLRVTSANEVKIVATSAHIRDICDIYRVDYMAFDLPKPAECVDLFTNAHEQHRVTAAPILRGSGTGIWEGGSGGGSIGEGSGGESGGWT